METDRVIEWLKTIPSCCGYPKCDGDLVGGEHTKDCPLYEKKALTTIELLTKFGQEEYERGQSDMRKRAGELASKKFAGNKHNRHDSIPFNTGYAIGESIRQLPLRRN